MRNKIVLSFIFCAIVFAQQVWPAAVDTTAAYMTVFGRPATSAEIAYWQSRLPASQAELVEINMNWLVSPAGAKDLKETVVRGFQQVFQRVPTSAEQQEWENKIKASRLKYQDFVTELKGTKLGTTTTTVIPGIVVTKKVLPVDVNGAYLTVFGRNATPAEIAYWQTHQLPATQQEFVELNMNWLVSAKSTAVAELHAVVARGFQQAFQREPSSAEKQKWENEIKISRLRYQDFVTALKNSVSLGQEELPQVKVPPINPPGFGSVQAMPDLIVKDIGWYAATCVTHEYSPVKNFYKDDTCLAVLVANIGMGNAGPFEVLVTVNYENGKSVTFNGSYPNPFYGVYNPYGIATGGETVYDGEFHSYEGLGKGQEKWLKLGLPLDNDNSYSGKSTSYNAIVDPRYTIEFTREGCMNMNLQPVPCKPQVAVYESKVDESNESNNQMGKSKLFLTRLEP